MSAHVRKWLGRLRDSFWLLPALLTLFGVLAAIALVDIERAGWAEALVRGGWVYNGGGTGARTLLGAVASSAIGVAGTVFSITIAALSLAVGQMGPRLLRNFTRDRGVQLSLGVFIATFAYSLMVLRSVRTEQEGLFTPHLALTFAIVLAFVCVGTLVYFVAHMANRINVDTVIDLVSQDVAEAVSRLTSDSPWPAPPEDDFWRGATEIRDCRRGYLQEIDAVGLAEWAAKRGAALRLLVKPGGYVFPGAPIALATRRTDGILEAIHATTALGESRVSSTDLEYAPRQLVEVAVRALSSGINDPHTAISVLDRLGAALCDVARVHLPTGVHQVDGRTALVIPAVTYAGLTDSMFHLIRQNADGDCAVYIRMLEILAIVMRCERDEQRRGCLRRHAALILEEAERDVGNPSDLRDVRHRMADFHESDRRGTQDLDYVE